MTYIPEQESSDGVAKVVYKGKTSMFWMVGGCESCLRLVITLHSIARPCILGDENYNDRIVQTPYEDEYSQLIPYEY